MDVQIWEISAFTPSIFLARYNGDFQGHRRGKLSREQSPRQFLPGDSEQNGQDTSRLSLSGASWTQQPVPRSQPSQGGNGPSSPSPEEEAIWEGAPTKGWGPVSLPPFCEAKMDTIEVKGIQTSLNTQ